MANIFIDTKDTNSLKETETLLSLFKDHKVYIFNGDNSFGESIEYLGGEKHPGPSWWKWEKVKEITNSSNSKFLWIDLELDGRVIGFSKFRYSERGLLIDRSLKDANIEELETFLGK